jgi:membrane protein DedA with SNARE-associated domain
VPSWLEGKPFALTFAVLFAIVLLRAQATYWLARAVAAGVLHTRLADKLTGPKTTRAIESLNRWGPPLVTVSFLTIGLQTVVNAAAGLIRMPWIRYTIAMVIGCVAWATIYATVGIAAFEASLALFARSPWALAGVLVLIIAVVTAVVIIRRQRRAAGAADGDDVSPATRTDANLT